MFFQALHEILQTNLKFNIQKIYIFPELSELHTQNYLCLGITQICPSLLHRKSGNHVEKCNYVL